MVLAGRLHEATALLTRPLEPGAAPIVGGGDLAYARTKLGRVLLLQGRPGNALRQLIAAAAALRANDGFGCLVWCLSLVAEAYALLGQPAEAACWAEESMVRRYGEFAVFDGDATRARAWVAAASGERSRAASQLITAADEQESRGQPAYALFAFHDALRLGARHVARRLETLAAGLDGPWPAAAATYARGVRTGDAASLEAAADAFAAIGGVSPAAEAAGEASVRWAASGCVTRAVAARAKATRLSRHQSGSDAALIPPLAETPSLAALTRREQEVATLACHGLSNPDIAKRLVLSVRTVESHLYAAYGKLGVGDRAQLATVLGSHSPATHRSQ